MNILSAIFSRPKPLHVVPRYHAATRRESKLAQQKRADVQLELAVFVATTTPERRKAEAEAYWAGIRAPNRLPSVRGSGQ